MIAENTALGRAGLPEDLGPMIASLLSEENHWVNAQRIEVAGESQFDVQDSVNRDECEAAGRAQVQDSAVSNRKTTKKGEQPIRPPHCHSCRLSASFWIAGNQRSPVGLRHVQVWAA